MSRIDLGQIPADYSEAFAAIEKVLENGSLDPVLREIGILAAVRRSEVETAGRLDTARAAGLDDEMIKAIADEDWTDSCFDQRTKIAFRFAMMYEAGHGIGSSVFDGLQEQLSDAEILELAAVCNHWGTRARAAVGFELTAED